MIVELPRLHPQGDDNFVPVQNIESFHDLSYGEGPGCRVTLITGRTIVTKLNSAEVKARVERAVQVSRL